MCTIIIWKYVFLLFSISSLFYKTLIWSQLELFSIMRKSVEMEPKMKVLKNKEATKTYKTQKYYSLNLNLRYHLSIHYEIIIRIEIYL